MLALGQILGLSTTELVLILLIVVVFFGAAKIPQLARSIGKAKGEFEKGAREGHAESKAATESEDERVRRAAREMGIPVEGRSLEEIKRDVRAKMS